MSKAENEGKSMEKCLQLLIKDLCHLQHGLDSELRTNKFIYNKLINACQEVPACQYACFKPSDTLAGLINDLRSSIVIFQKANPFETFFTDRQYHKYPDSRKFLENRRFQPRSSYDRDTTKKKCFVCHKEGCWSTKHTKSEREEAKDLYRNQFRDRMDKRFERRANQYISEYEGADSGSADGLEDDSEDLDNEMEALMIDIPESSKVLNPRTDSETFITSFGAMEHAKIIVSNLTNRSFDHSLTGTGPTTLDNTVTSANLDPFTYVITERYTSDEFYGIMIDTGASKHSTAGYGQYLAYKKDNKNISIDITKAEAIHVQFDIGSISSEGSIIIDTPAVGQIEFHIVKADTLFLLSLADMDRLRIYLINVKNTLVTEDRAIPIICRFGHPFLLWKTALQSYITQSFDTNPCYLTDIELRQLHRRFEHPSAMKLYLLLERSGHEVDKPALDKLTKFCSFCQKHGKSPGRFKFTLRDDVNFNYSIIVDIMYIDNSPILHVVDKATRFQAARWLSNVSAKHTWDIL